MSVTNSNSWDSNTISPGSHLLPYVCHTAAEIDSFFHWQWLHAVLGHRWLNHLLQTGEIIEKVFPESVSGARLMVVPWVSRWISLVCDVNAEASSLAVSAAGQQASSTQPLMFKTCRDRIPRSSQLFDTGREKEARRINVFAQRRLTSFVHPDHCSFIL